MVKKLNKKIMVMVLSGVLSVMSCIPVMAAEDVSVHVHEGQNCVEEEISPLANYEACVNCKTGEMVPSLRGVFPIDETRLCPHYSNATWYDKVTGSESVTVYTCNQCGYEEIARNRTEIITCAKP